MSLLEIIARHLCARAGADVPNPDRPLLEFGVVRDPLFKSDGLVFGQTGEFPRCGCVPTLPVLHRLRIMSECDSFAEPGHIAPVPLHAELEALVGIFPLSVDTEFFHRNFSLGLDLAGHLLDLDDHKLRRLKWCEVDKDVHDALGDFVRGHRAAVTPDKVSII